MSAQDVRASLARSQMKCLFHGDKVHHQESLFTSDFRDSRLLHINGWILLALQQNICLCIYVLWSRGEADGVEMEVTGREKEEKKPTSPLKKKKGFSALKLWAVSLPLWYLSLSILFLSLISHHPPVSLHIPKHFPVFFPTSLTRDETIKLDGLPAKQKS